MNRPTILLFDIDGTLVSTAGAGRRAMIAAFADVQSSDSPQPAPGIEGSPCDFPFGGMTDRAIAREGLRRSGVAVDEAAIDGLLERYLVHLEREAAGGVGFVVLPGIREAIREARQRAGFAVGLGTGNIRRGAELKLTPVGLYDHFSFGGFGCDHEDRAELVRAGAIRGAALLGATMRECRVVVIGDTPRDVAAAKAVGADCLAVATGGYTIEELRDCGATFVFPDLATSGALSAMLHG